MQKSNHSKPHFWITIPVLSVLGLCVWIFVAYPKEPLVSLPVYPKGNHSFIDQGFTTQLYVDQNGFLWSEESKVSESELSKQLDSLKSAYGENISFNIHADKNLAFSEIWNLIEILKAKGFWKLNLVFQKPKSDGFFPLEFYAPKLKECSMCSDSQIIFEGDWLIIDLNSRSGRFDSGKIIPWDNIPCIINNLYDIAPTKPFTLIVNPNQKYNKLVNDLSFLGIADLSVSLLSAHHSFKK